MSRQPGKGNKRGAKKGASKVSEDTDEEFKVNPIVEAFRASQIGLKMMKP